jgi:hypothetical protein
MAKIQLDPAEVEQLQTSREELLELQEQIDQGVAAGVVAPALSEANRQTLDRIEGMLSTFVPS